MASILGYTKTTVSEPDQVGDGGIRMEGLAVPNDRFIPEGINIFSYSVPNNNYCTLESLNLTFNNPVFSVGSIVATTVDGGVFKLRQGTTDKFEARLQVSPIQANVSGGQEVVNRGLQQQRFDFGDGIIFTTSDTINLTVSPTTANLGVTYFVTIVGLESGTINVRKGRLTPNSTTVDQAILSYTPAADYTLYSITVEAILFGSHIINGGFITLNGMTLWEFGPFSMSQNCPVFMGDTNDTINYGTLSIPLLGLVLNQNDKLEVFVNPTINNDATIIGQLSGTTTTYSGGGGGSSEHSYLFIG